MWSLPAARCSGWGWSDCRGTAGLGIRAPQSPSQQGPLDGIKEVPHPEEAAKRPSRRTHDANPTVRYRSGSAEEPVSDDSETALDKAIKRLRKNTGMSSFRGAVDPRAISLARPSRRTSDGRARHVARGRDPGNHQHSPVKSMVWLMFMGSRPGPQGPSRNDNRVFPQPLKKSPQPRPPQIAPFSLRRPISCGV